MWLRLLPHSGTCSGCFQSAIAAIDSRARLKRMSSSVALASVARRLSDLLSSGGDDRVKSKRKAMDQPRTDEDQQLVARTQSGDASAFDQLVVKYTPRLYGLVYNMTSNHEDTNDLLQDVFSKAYK